MHLGPSGIGEIFNLEKISKGNGPFFSILSWRIEYSSLELFSIVKILKKKFSFSSRNSRFWRKFLFLFSIEILRTDSLLESKNFERKNSVSPSILPSNFCEKSCFAIWLDFDQQRFAERESILKGQFCAVLQYSNFSQQKHYGDSILQHTIFFSGMLRQNSSLCQRKFFVFRTE